MAAMKKGRAELRLWQVLDRTHRPQCQRGYKKKKTWLEWKLYTRFIKALRNRLRYSVWSVLADRNERSVRVIFTSKSAYETETIQYGKILKHLRVKNDTLFSPPKHWMQQYVWWHWASRSFQQPTQKRSSRDGVITACFSTWWDMGTHSRTRRGESSDVLRVGKANFLTVVG